MEWFSWLTKTGLHPSLAYHYALTFSHNQLDQHDIPFFTHELLQSMGISIAKHRLQIINLARQHRGGRRIIHPPLWFSIAFQRTKAYLANIKKSRNSSMANAALPHRNQSLRWKVAMLQRSNIPRAPKPQWLTMHEAALGTNESDHKILMLTNGSSSSIRSSSSEETSADYEQANPSNSSFSSAVIHSVDGDIEVDIKWDSMFQNLKPT